MDALVSAEIFAVVRGSLSAAAVTGVATVAFRGSLRNVTNARPSADSKTAIEPEQLNYRGKHFTVPELGAEYISITPRPGKSTVPIPADSPVIK